MVRLSLSRILPTLVLAWLLVLPGIATGQRAEVRRLAEDARGVTLEITIDWPSSLRAALDSARTTTLTPRLAGRLTGQLFSVSESFTLPVLAQPGLQVLGADFDEATVTVPSDSLSRDLAGPVARVVGLGFERKNPAATLLARMLTYDPARGTLRRYRRLTVQLTYAAAPVSTSNRVVRDSPHVTIDRSVLADGVVFRIPVSQEGIYRIDRATLAPILEKAGVNISTVDPKAIKLYGNGGEPLPALNAAPRPVDLVENAVFVRTDGSAFSELYFYGKAPAGWRYEPGSGRWTHYVNPFTTENYYFLKIDAGSTNARRVTEVPFPGWPDAASVATLPGRYFVEPEEVNWARDSQGGLNWLSRQIRPGEQRTVLPPASLPGFTGGEVRYEARVAIKSNPAVPVRFQSGSAVLTQLVASPVSSRTDAPVANPVEGTFTQQVSSGGAPELIMALQNGANSPEAALDWVRVFYPQALRAQDGVLRFVTPATQAGRVAFLLSGFTTEPQVWDVTDPTSIRRLGVQASGNGQFTVQMEVLAGSPREILAFTATQPVKGMTRVPAQNLHGIQGYPQMVIVTPDTFRVYAEELAEHRRSQGLQAQVVDVAQIYNEFSGGVPDMRAIRDYLKFLYDRAPDANSLIRYALLFGDGHYDFRGISKPPFPNWVPSFQTEETLDPERSYTSDDYFGLLDDSEGVWSFGFSESISTERVDIGIGRLTVQTAEDARAVVDKIRRYDDPSTDGAWRSRYLFVADDEYNGRAHINVDDDLHVQNTEAVAVEVAAEAPAMNQEKVYMIAYEPQYSTEWRVPGAKRDLLAALNEGVLLFNYSGHGNENALSQEAVLTRSDAAAMENGRVPSIFVIATCSFGRWDMTAEQSGAEVLLDNPNGGAIALFTTVRTVYTSSNVNSLNVGLNRALNREIFKPDVDGKPRRLGDIMRETKNTEVGLQSNSRKFNLLGDPSMRIGLPEATTAITRLGGKSIVDTTAQMPAMERITIEGEVRTPSGTVDAGFNGRATLTVYDAARDIPIRTPRYLDSFSVRDALIWRGDVRVEAGRYTATFVVPRDISYANKPGRISAYAWSETTQAIGYNENVIVGGTSQTAADDKQGPAIELFVNDTTFVEGGLVPSRPEVIVRLQDLSGVNTVGTGVGHELLLVLDNREEDAIDVGSYYQSDEGSYQRGTVRYPLAEFLRSDEAEVLPPGPHTLKVKAWDVLNNASVAETSFYVTASDALTIRNVLNYPNPTPGATRFVFEHNQPSGTPARVELRIYSISGRPIRTIDTEEALPTGILPGGIVQIPWDGRDEDFSPLGTGVYLYRLRVEVDTPDGERQVSEQIEKLAVIR